MKSIENPGAVAALGASLDDQLGRRVITETTRHHRFTQLPIRAELIGSSRCNAEGLSARGYAPVLDLCRELVAAGFNPVCPLEAWRGKTLCLRVRSIGEGARLTVADDRHGTPRLRRRQECPPGYVAGPPVAQTDKGLVVPTPLQRAMQRAVP